MIYNVEVHGNGIYTGKVFLYPDNAEFFPVAQNQHLPVFVSSKYKKYWDAYEAADSWARENVK